MLCFAEEEEEEGTVWHGGTPQEEELLLFDDNIARNVGLDTRSNSDRVLDPHKPHHLRSPSKADLRREGLLSAASRATK